MILDEHRRALAEAIAGCERLIDQIEGSSDRISALVPLDAPSLRSLAIEDWDTLYAFQMKFLLLQDLANRRLVRGFLAMAGEEIGGLSLRQTIDRAADLGVIADRDDWLQLTAVRNLLVHEYPVDLDQFAIRLDDAWSRCERLITNVQKLIDALQRSEMI